ncbi:hypothetical protein BC567DRAFT_95998 [Phyllosticta citribraziliensis]
MGLIGWSKNARARAFFVTGRWAFLLGFCSLCLSSFCSAFTRPPFLLLLLSPFSFLLPSRLECGGGLSVAVGASVVGTFRIPLTYGTSSVSVAVWRRQAGRQTVSLASLSIITSSSSSFLSHTTARRCPSLVLIPLFLCATGTKDKDGPFVSDISGEALISLSSPSSLSPRNGRRRSRSDVRRYDRLTATNRTGGPCRGDTVPSVNKGRRRHVKAHLRDGRLLGDGRVDGWARGSSSRTNRSRIHGHGGDGCLSSKVD